VEIVIASMEIVIASAAKQSMSPRKERMDCFAALAMTANEPSLSRGTTRARAHLAHPVRLLP
jgi:hypothetical protein